MLKPETPLKLILRGDVPSLKNERTHLLTENENTGKIQSISLPQQDVIKYINGAKAAFKRQLPKDWEILRKPSKIALWVELGVYYLSDLPRSDVDNACTTIQESLMGVVIEDDVQVIHLHARRVRFKNQMKDLLPYSNIYIWSAIEGNELEECQIFLDYLLEQRGIEK